MISLTNRIAATIAFQTQDGTRPSWRRTNRSAGVSPSKSSGVNIRCVPYTPDARKGSSR